MNMPLIIGIIVLVLIILYVFVTYNSFVKLKNRVKEAFSTMDVYLKKRWDLIPNIVEVVKGYAKHEKDTLKEVVELRNSVYDKMDDETKVDTNNKITQGLTKIMALAEAYPDLKADKNFRELQTELSKVEEDIANARKYYNGSIRLYNNKVQMIPSNIVAKLFGYKEEKMFEIDSLEKENVKVEL
ncbi:MAG: LemA family protein [Bacilli bacterium]|nr:LemA family protein [Bacilli bacterium]